MKKFVKINLLTLGATLILYGFVLRPRQSALARAIQTIPFFQQTKNKIFVEVGKEVLKFVGAYFLLNTLRVR